MKLFEMYELIGYITNKDYEGMVITPDQFAKLSKVANLELFKIKMGLPEDYAPGQYIPRQHPNATQIMKDDLKFLFSFDSSKAVTSGITTYPNDYFTLESLRHVYQRTINGESTEIKRKVEVLTEDELSDRLGRWVKKPTIYNPVAVIRADGIHIYPDTINQVEISYIRYPEEPVFAYNVESGYITEDESGTTEYEWPEHLHVDLVRIMLAFVGLNIRDEQIYQYAEQKKVQGV